MAVFGSSRRLFQEPSATSWQARRGRLPVILAVVCSLAMLAVSRLDPVAVAPIGRTLIEVTAPIAAITSPLVRPVVEALSGVLATFASRHDVNRLRAENARLTAMAANLADLQLENGALRRAAHFVGHSGQRPVMARVIASSAGPISRSVLIDAGRDQGIDGSAAVVDDTMLIGRVVDVQTNTSHVMLLSDGLSRVPVQIGVGQIRAVLIGNGTPEPQLDFIASDAAVTLGDLVTTSGLGGIFPSRLVIGTVSGTAQRWGIVLAPTQETPFVVGILSSLMTTATRAAPVVSQTQALTTDAPALSALAPAVSKGPAPSPAQKAKGKVLR